MVRKLNIPIYRPDDMVYVSDKGGEKYAIIHTYLPDISIDYDSPAYQIRFMNNTHYDLWIDYGNNFRYATDGEIEFLNKKYKLNIPLRTDPALF